MKNFKNTPGPWQIDGSLRTAIFSKSEDLIARVIAENPFTNGERILGNSVLISKAPEMQDLLIRAKEALDDRTKPCQEILADIEKLFWDMKVANQTL